MSRVLITESLLTNIANAIRSKTGGTAGMTPAEMATEITGISTGGDISLSDITSGNYPVGVVDITGLSFVNSALANRLNITKVIGTSNSTKSNLFSECNTITSINLSLTGAGPSWFFNCKGLVTAILKITNNNYATSFFNSCTNLEIADLDVTAIKATMFNSNNKLQTVILRNTNVVTLDNISAFQNTPVRGYNGLTATIYVPSDLISSYQTASNWSTIYSAGYVTFAAIEGSAYETTYADGTAIS